MKPFTLEVIRDYKLFYMLKKLNGNSPRIVLSHQQSHTNAVVEGYELFRMADNSVLVAFDRPFQRTPDYNYVASDGRTEEIVPVHCFERIMPYYKMGPEAHKTGAFIFSNSSIPKNSGQDWRCDNEKYGPKTFAQILDNEVVFKTVNDIEVYETIFAVNGVGYIQYMKQKVRYEDAEEVFVNAETPFTTYTLAENVKLVLEWAAVNNPTFDNYEDIAVKAKQLVTRLGITEDLVANQPDMQVFEYLKGNTSARLRPDGVQPMSEELDKFIQTSNAHLTLSKIISLYPTAWDLTEVVAYEKEYARQEWEEALIKYHVLETKEYGDVDGVCEYIAEALPGTLAFVKNFFTILNRKKELLEEIA